MTWDAFLSYSHAADGRLAPAVQNGLQRLAKPWFRRRALRVFRDETSMAVDPRLWGSIQTALDQAGYFVLLTSPQAASSHWVNREIEYWLSHRDPDRLLPVLTEGDWVWDPGSGDFDAEQSPAVPPALRGAFAEEPFYLDLRWARDETQLDLRNGRFRDAMADLAAPIHGLPKDDLVGEDIRLHRRARRLASTALVTLVVLTLGAAAAAVLAVRNANTAEHRRVEAVAQRLSLQSAQNEDRPDLAFLLAAEAYRMDPTVETEAAVRSAAQSLEDVELALMLRHDAPMRAVAVDPERDLIVAGDAEGTITFHDRVTGTVRATGSIKPDIIHDLLVDKERGQVIVVGYLGVSAWSLDSLTQIGETVSSLVPIVGDGLAAAGSRAAFAQRDGSVAVWDLGAGVPVALFDTGSGSVLGVALSPDGALVATAGEEGTVAVWAVDDPGIPRWSVPAAHIGTANAVAFSPDGERVVSGGGDGVVRVWDNDGGDLIASRLQHAGIVWDVEFSTGHPLGDYIVSAGDDGVIGWLDAGTYARFDPTRVHQGPVNAVRFASDGTYASAGEDGLVAYFDLTRAIDTAATRVRFEGVPVGMAIDPGGERVAVGAGDRVAWYALDGTPTGPAVTTTAPVRCLAYRAADGRLAIGTADGTVLGWDSAADPVTMTTLESPPAELAYAPAGDLLVAIDGAEELWTWEATSDGLTGARRLEKGGWRGLSYSPDGSLLAYAGAPYQVDVVDPRRDRLVATLGGSLELFFTTAFHPTRPLVAASDSLGRVRFWDTATWEEVGEPLIGHEGLVTGVAFTADGSAAVTTGSDGTVRIWDLDRRAEIGLAVRSHSMDIVAMAYHSDREVVVTGSADSTALFRELGVETWLAQGCALIGRDLSDAELVAFQIDRPHDALCG